MRTKKFLAMAIALGLAVGMTVRSLMDLMSPTSME